MQSSEKDPQYCGAAFQAVHVHWRQTDLKYDTRKWILTTYNCDPLALNLLLLNNLTILVGKKATASKTIKGVSKKSKRNTKALKITEVIKWLF